jgi:hypothetical protein
VPGAIFAVIAPNLYFEPIRDFARCQYLISCFWQAGVSPRWFTTFEAIAVATDKPRINVVLHRFTHRVLKQYADHHGLSMSELLSLAGLLIARLIKLESDEAERERNVPATVSPEMLLDLYRLHPDYDPDRALGDLSRALKVLGGTIGKVKKLPPPPSPKRSKSPLPVGLQGAEGPGPTAAESAAEHAEMVSGLEGLYQSLVETTREVDAASRRFAKKMRLPSPGDTGTTPGTEEPRSDWRSRSGLKS